MNKELLKLLYSLLYIEKRINTKTKMEIYIKDNV